MIQVKQQGLDHLDFHPLAQFLHDLLLRFMSTTNINVMVYLMLHESTQAPLTHTPNLIQKTLQIPQGSGNNFQCS